MKDPLVRFGVAVEAPLLEEFDALVRARQCTRSELLRDLARAEVVKAKVRSGAKAVATLTIVYDHHVRDLSEKLTELQHDLSHDLCLEVIVMRGRADDLQSVANRILATRGVRHGGIEIISESGAAADHEHDHGHGHVHGAPHTHKKTRKRPTRKA
jgi:CopG family nickel-responsive transcriptional regulator